MRARSQTKADDIDLMSLIAALRRNAARIMLVSALAGGATFGVLSMMAPRFVSEAQLAIVAKSTNPFPDAKKEGANAEAIAPRLDKEAVNTHVRALMGTDLVLGVADELKLKSRPEFNSALGSIDLLSRLLRMAGLGGARPGQSEQDRVIEVVYKQLEVAAARESRFINVRFTSVDPSLAAQFANQLADSYRRKLVTIPVKETEDVVSALEPKVEQLRKELVEAEAEVMRERARSDQFRGGSTATPLNDQRLAALSDELIKAEAVRGDTESRWRTARELMQSDSADVLPDVQKSPLIQQLINQRVRLERQVAEAEASLLPAHPRMQQLNADLRGLKRQINGEIAKVVQGLEKDLKAATIRVETVTRQINEVKSKVVTSSDGFARLKSLESSVASKRAELEGLQKQLEVNRTLKATRAVPIEAQIVSQARPSSVPVFPKKGPWSMLAALAALILGAVAVVTREIVSGPAPGGAGGSDAGPSGKGRARADSASLEPQLAMPSSATAKVAEAAPVAAAAVRKGAAAKAASAPAPASSAADRLLAKAGDQHGYRTLVTGDSAASDGTKAALAIARRLADTGKHVVLVDWSLDGTGLAREIGVATAPGVTDILIGSATFEGVIARVPDSDVHFVASGDKLADAGSLQGDRLNLVLDALDEAYDHIVVTGRYEDARDLFQAIQGRFDAGVLVCGTGADAEPAGDVFLGFEVADMEIVRIAQAAAGTPPAQAPPAETLAAVAPAKAAAPVAAKRSLLSRVAGREARA